MEFYIDTEIKHLDTTFGFCILLYQTDIEKISSDEKYLLFCLLMMFRMFFAILHYTIYRYAYSYTSLQIIRIQQMIEKKYFYWLKN